MVILVGGGGVMMMIVAMAFVIPLRHDFYKHIFVPYLIF